MATSSTVSSLLSASGSGASLYFSGLASGVDTDSIVAKLMTVERRPETLLQNKADLYTAKSDVYSSYSAKISSLEDAVLELRTSGIFNRNAISSSNTGVASAHATGSNIVAGSFIINVTGLATAAIVNGSQALYTGANAQAQPASAASSSAVNALGQTVDPSQSLAATSTEFNTQPQASGTLVMNGVNIQWDDSMSLNDVIGRINNSGAKVTASFNAGTQSFSLKSNATGSTSTLAVSETSGNLLEALNITPGTTSGSDAVATDLTQAVGTAAAHLDTAITSGTFTLNHVTFSIDAATDSLQTIINRINQSSAGVVASYDEATGKIGLMQKATGSANQIVLGAAGDSSNFWSAVKLSANQPPVGGGADTYSGTNASVSVNGGAVQSLSSNTVTGLVPNVSLTLNGIGTSTVTAQPDIDGMVTKIKNFVDDYNAVMDFINTKLDEEVVESPTTTEERMQGTFRTDSLFVETKYNLSSIVTDAVPGLSGTLNQLAQIGINLTSKDYGKSATLEVDETALRTALASNAQGVDDIFNDASGGILGRLSSKLKSMTNYVSGSLTIAQNNLSSEVTDINKRIADMEEALAKRETALRTQFTNMETAIAKMNSLSSQLASMLSSSK